MPEQTKQLTVTDEECDELAYFFVTKDDWNKSESEHRDAFRTLARQWRKQLQEKQ